MNDIKLNIVKLVFNENLEEDNIYKYCHDTVKKEFPNDNIIVFHSLEEIEEKYYIPHIKYYNWCKEHWLCSYLCDYIRLYLTNYIDNMVYIDPDIEVFPGFRNEIIQKAQNKTFICSTTGHWFFFSRCRNSLVNSIIKEEYILFFNKEVIKNNKEEFYNLFSDYYLMNRVKLKHTYTANLCNYFMHYYAMSHLRFDKNKTYKIFHSKNIVEDKISYLKQFVDKLDDRDGYVNLVVFDNITKHYCPLFFDDFFKAKAKAKTIIISSDLQEFYFKYIETNTNILIESETEL